MGYILFFIFIGVPVVEISVFFLVGGIIGLGPTIAIVLLTAFAGAWALRAQGMATLIRAQDHLQRGEFPIAQVFDGICLLVAGAFLLTPGFVTDSLGFLLFLPPVRALLARTAQTVLIRRGQSQDWPGDRQNYETRTGQPDDGPIIEGDFEEIKPDPKKINRE